MLASDIEYGYRKQLEAAKQREMELLAVIDEQNKFLERCITDEFGISNKYLRKEIEERYITPTQLLREHEAKVIEPYEDAWDDLLEDMELHGMHKFEPYIKSKANFCRMAEERRKK